MTNENHEQAEKEVKTDNKLNFWKKFGKRAKGTGVIGVVGFGIVASIAAFAPTVFPAIATGSFTAATLGATATTAVTVASGGIALGVFAGIIALGAAGYAFSKYRSHVIKEKADTTIITKSNYEQVKSRKSKEVVNEQSPSPEQHGNDKKPGLTSPSSSQLQKPPEQQRGDG